MTDNRIQDYAKSSGYDFAEKIDVIYNGYEVYSLRYNGREKGVTYHRGYLYFLLVKENEVHKTTPEQSLEILQLINDNKED